MGWTNQGIEQLTLPGSAGPNDPQIKIGPELPPCMQADFSAALFFVPPDSQTGVLANDSPLWFMAQYKTTGAAVQVMAEGFLLYDPTAGFCGYVVTRERVASWTFGQLALTEWMKAGTGSGNVPFLGRPSFLYTDVDLNVGSGAVLNIDSGGVFDVQSGAQLRVEGKRSFLLTELFTASAAADITLSTAQQIAATINFTTLTAPAWFLASWHVDVDMTVAGTCVATAEVDININGGGAVPVSGQARQKVAAITDGGTPGQQARIQIPAVGAHTIRLLVRKSAAVGTVFARQTNTRLIGQLFESGS